MQAKTRHTAIAAALSLLAGTAPAGAENNFFAWKCTFEGVGTPVTVAYQPPGDSGIVVQASDTNPAIVKVGSDAISFLDVTNSGVAKTISIQIETGDAVYSRGDVFVGKLVSVQSRGICERQ